MNRKEQIILGVLGLLIGACGCIAAWLVVPQFQKMFSPPLSATPMPSAIVSQPTNTIVVTSLAVTPATANLAQPTYSLSPTFTASPLPTILPTTTPKQYYDQGESVVLKDGIYMSLSDEFLTEGGPCGIPKPGFGVKIVIENTIDQQYLIRFNSSDFHAVDDLGNKYKLVYIGNNGDGFCDVPIGVPSEYTMSWGYWTSYIPLSFQGQIPLQATYILITADWISGIGPIVFRKDIN